MFKNEGVAGYAEDFEHVLSRKQASNKIQIIKKHYTNIMLFNASKI